MSSVLTRIAITALSLVLAVGPALVGAEPAAKIMRPSDGAWLRDSKLDIIATAPNGKLFVDGEALDAEEPFPNVFHAKVEVSPGEHVISIRSTEGTQEARIYVGPSAADGFAAFRSHPPAAIECADCHSVSRRGRFRFSGNCFSCHAKDAFAKPHSHEPHVLQSCGLCHNAHGSTAAKHLVMAKDVACKQCHN